MAPGEAATVARAHAVMQACTYATYAHGNFTSVLLEDLEGRTQRVEETDVVLVAKNPWGNIVGIAMADEGPEWWERPESPDFVQPAVTRTLKTLFTMPGTHGSGLGARLLDAVLPDGESAYLWTMTANPRAIRFYEKHGFVADGFSRVSHGWGEMEMIRMVRLRNDHRIG